MSKKFSKIAMIFVFFAFIPIVSAEGFCEFNEVKRILKIIGYAILIIRIIVPILLIVFIMMDLMKYFFINDSNDKTPEYKNHPKKMLGRFVAAICVFLIPTFISLILNIVDDHKINESANDCFTCLNTPYNCKTTTKLTIPEKQ